MRINHKDMLNGLIFSLDCGICLFKFLIIALIIVFLFTLYSVINGITILQIRRGNRDNLGIISNISP